MNQPTEPTLGNDAATLSQTHAPHETTLSGKFSLRLHVHEEGTEAWFEAIVRLDALAVQHGIRKCTVFVQVGLDGDTAAYPCRFLVEPSTFLHMEASNSTLEEVIAEKIQAAVWSFKPLAEGLRQRASQRLSNDASHYPSFT